MIYENYFRSIHAYVLAMKPGRIFDMSELEPIATYDSIRKSLTRLCDDKFLIRVVPGIYCAKPSSDNFPPVPSQVVEVLAQSNQWTVIPGTELARYLTGLTAHRPEDNVYFSTGRSSRYEYCGIKLYLQHSNATFLKFMSPKTALVTSALMDLHTHKITPHEIMHFGATLSDEEKALLMKERIFAPARLRGVFEIICGEYGSSGK